MDTLSDCKIVRPSTGWKLRIATSILAFVVTLNSPMRLFADDSQLRSTERLTDEDVLLLFCDDGCLFDRGVTNTPFAGSTDLWILWLIAHDLNFGRSLGITDEQRTLAARVERDDADPKSDALVFGALTKIDNGSPEDIATWVDRIDTILTRDQKKKLPAVYLALEGMMALRRTEFQALIGMTQQQQAAIVNVVDKCLEDEALPLHRGIFSIPKQSMRQLPELHLQLRTLSAKLDHAILESLPNGQRQKLAPIIRQAYELQKVVASPGCE